jgi:hypothetical protein
MRFEDTTVETYSVGYANVQANGLRAGYACSWSGGIGLYGGAAQFSVAMARAMQANGHEIMCHGFDTPLPAPTEIFRYADQTSWAATEMRRAGLDIAAWVQPGWTGANPFLIDDVGDWGGHADLLLRINFACYTAQIAGGLGGGLWSLPLAATDRWGYAPGLTWETQTYASLVAWLDTAIANGNLAMIGGHAASIGLPGNLSIADFTAFLAYAASKVASGDLVIRTPSEILCGILV